MTLYVLCCLVGLIVHVCMSETHVSQKECRVKANRKKNIWDEGSLEIMGLEEEEDHAADRGRLSLW